MIVDHFYFKDGCYHNCDIHDNLLTGTLHYIHDMSLNVFFMHLYFINNSTSFDRL